MISPPGSHDIVWTWHFGVRNRCPYPGMRHITGRCSCGSTDLQAQSADDIVDEMRKHHWAAKWAKEGPWEFA